MVEADQAQGPEPSARGWAGEQLGRWSSRTMAMYLLVLAAYLLHTLRFNFLCDDAYISFRYARNLAGGLGLRFNPGESPPVEGFSNFLGVLLLSVFERLGMAPAIWSRVLSVLCGVVLVVLLLGYLHRRLGLPVGVVFLAGLFFALFPPVAVWSTSGLATVPFALLVFVTFERLLGDPGRVRAVSAGLAGLGVVLMRTEGFAWALVLGVVATAAWWMGGRRDRPARWWVYGSIVLVGFGVFWVWRRCYFGDWWPNTAYAKADLTAFTLLRGWNYAVRFALHLLSPGVILMASLSLWSRPGGGPASTSALMIAASFAAAILVGGDFMPFDRLFVVGTPFLTILLACVLGRIWARALGRRVLATSLAAGCVVLSMLAVLDIHPVPASALERFRFRWAFFRQQSELVPVGELRAWQRSKMNCESWARTGRALKLVAAESDSLVQGGIGAVGYYSGLHLYDLGGLVDREVARRRPAPARRSAGHDKAVPIAFFEKYAPTYVYAVLARRGPGLGGRVSRIHATYLARPAEGDLKSRYSPVVLSLPPGKGFDSDEVLVVGKRNPP